MLRHFQSIGFDQHVVQLTSAQGLKGRASIVYEAEAQLGIGHTVAIDQAVNVLSLGGLGAQELQAGGDIVEEILYRDHCALGATLFLLVSDPASLQAQ